MITRRRLLAGSCAVSAGMALPIAAIGQNRRHALAARPGVARLRGQGLPPTPIWGYDGITPGPVLRVRQGETLEVAFTNRLEPELTIHWHGIRLPNAMDGVPHLTQKPVQRGETFLYRFAAPDAGTYIYHPHGRAAGLLGRGLYGALIVEERTPPEVDRDLVWLLADWKLGPDGRIDPDFEDEQAQSHEGRIGNHITVNGAPAGAHPVVAGERLRLRLANIANARLFHLGFGGIDPWLLALDGQPIAPRRLGKERLVLGPGMRADVILDVPPEPGTYFNLADDHPARETRALANFVPSSSPPRRTALLPPPVPLAANPIPSPDLDRAERHEIVFAGGASPGHHAVHGHGRPKAPPARRKEPRAAWTVNGRSLLGHADHRPSLTLRQGLTHVLALTNDNAWDHPVHLHGFVFRVLTRNGKPEPHTPVTDTILLGQHETAEIAFLADNPGDWMLHCHILEHADAGMGTVLRVS